MTSFLQYLRREPTAAVVVSSEAARFFFFILSLPLRGQDCFENPPVRCSKAEAHTPLTEIFRKIKSGESLPQGETDREFS